MGLSQKLVYKDVNFSFNLIRTTPLQLSVFIDRHAFYNKVES